jgi:O-antigen ligase
VDTVLQELIRQGILGLVLVLIVLGWLVPKPTLEALEKRIAILERIIQDQATVNARQAQKAVK